MSWYQRCRSPVLSERSSRYGIHPMPPSASENVRFGNFCSAPLNSRSTVVHIRFEENRIVGMTNGAIFDSEAAVISLAVGLSAMNEKPGTNEPDPQCSD